VMVGLMLVYSINLPQMDELARYRPSTTTELYDIHGKVFGSFALERRVVVPYAEFPELLKQAIFSIEDKDFETNGGINLVRAASAAYHDIHSKGKAQGASTLTMQLSRNLFLSSEKTYSRKIQEIFLTLQIERRFTKQQIFTLYANQIYLGRGTYGFEAGSEYYFSKHARDLTLPEAALLAALPKGPEEYSPVRHPERALKRRNLVLSEMLSDKKITWEQAAAAKAAPLGLHIEPPVNTEAPYFVEEVRRQLEAEYGVEEAHGAGLKVYTTLDIDLQRVANKAVLDGTAAYERRHGWKGKLQNVLNGGGDLESYRHPDWIQPIKDKVEPLIQAAAKSIIDQLGSRDSVFLATFARRFHIIDGYTTDHARLDERLPELRVTDQLDDFDGSGICESSGQLSVFGGDAPVVVAMVATRAKRVRKRSANFMQVFPPGGGFLRTICRRDLYSLGKACQEIESSNKCRLKSPHESQSRGHSAEAERKPGDVIARVAAVNRAQSVHDPSAEWADRFADNLRQTFPAKRQRRDDDGGERPANSPSHAFDCRLGFFGRTDFA